jgi:hypothetical protein
MIPQFRSQEGCPVIRRPSTTAITALAIALLTVTGCAGKLRLSGKMMCEAHGGTYDATGRQCSYKAQTLSAKQICQNTSNGYWDDVAQFCELN